MDEIGADPQRSDKWRTIVALLWLAPLSIGVCIGLFLLIPLVIVWIGALFGYDSNPPVP